ncbi:excisionase family DNA-binding protein [Bacillus sp. FJAT-45350]|uniref:excisionase family DNA-binding protein n=1 Tax=Bacillus sp. FJAT-45350 TaxID=2011014 RepID=UPI000BB96F7B|nr:excisionase family DNA-binding protein [Bacillus sp. FJAT-45350]
MYITVQELAEYLGVTPDYILEQVNLGNIKAVYDGEKYLFNKEQFSWHKEEIEKKLIQLRKEEEEPLPEDIDVKDED